MPSRTGPCAGHATGTADDRDTARAHLANARAELAAAQAAFAGELPWIGNRYTHLARKLDDLDHALALTAPSDAGATA